MAVAGRTVAAIPGLPIVCSWGYVGERLGAQRSIGRDSDLVGELVYNLREIQQVVEKTCGKTRRYQKLPESEAANRVGVFRAQSPLYSSSCSRGAPYEPFAMTSMCIAQRLVESYLGPAHAQKCGGDQDV